VKLGVRKKTEKHIKPRKPEKNNRKNKTLKKSIRILKKPNGLVRFYKPETKKTEPNRTQTEKNQKKPSQIGKTDLNRFLFLKNRIEPKPVDLNRFWFFFKNISVWLLFFFIKTKSN
jgi:hypothetical protein